MMMGRDDGRRRGRRFPLDHDVLRVVAAFLPCTRNLSHACADTYAVLRYWTVDLRDHSLEHGADAVAGWPVQRLRGRFVDRWFDLHRAHHYLAGCSDTLRVLTLDLHRGDVNAAWTVAGHLPRLETFRLSAHAPALTQAGVALVLPFTAPRLRTLRVRLRGVAADAGVVERLARAAAASVHLRSVGFYLAGSAEADAGAAAGHLLFSSCGGRHYEHLALDTLPTAPVAAAAADDPPPPSDPSPLVSLTLTLTVPTDASPRARAELGRTVAAAAARHPGLTTIWVRFRCSHPASCDVPIDRIRRRFLPVSLPPRCTLRVTMLPPSAIVQ
jgi:hypothetical protein